jgi:hypothetical protein
MIHVVCCIDCEGPLDETPEFAAWHKGLPFLHAWQGVRDAMVRLTGPERGKLTDSLGLPARFSWFVLDNVGWQDNPRRRAMGFHEIWDQTLAAVASPELDGWGFHHHVVPPCRHAVEYSTTAFSTPWLEQSLCRRLLDREHFPSVFRAGGTVMRNDLSRYLERFIPFDYSPLPGYGEPGAQMDWRGTPRWPYRPTWSDYRHAVSYTPYDSESGWEEMRRWMVPAWEDSWLHTVSEADIPDEGIFAFALHDRRDPLPAIQRITALLKGREWKWATARDAIVEDAGIPDTPAPVLTIEREGDLYWIRSDREGFGATPFLAVDDGRHVWRDEPTSEGNNTWAYKPQHPVRLAVALSSVSGRVGVAHLSAVNDKGEV